GRGEFLLLIRKAYRTPEVLHLPARRLLYYAVAQAFPCRVHPDARRSSADVPSPPDCQRRLSKIAISVHPRLRCTFDYGHTRRTHRCEAPTPCRVGPV